MLDVQYQKKFLKDLANIPSRERKEIEHFVFDVLPFINAIKETGKFEKMSGYDNFFKARFGNYRIGVYYHDSRIELRRVLSRKEIYKYFP